MIMKRSLIGAGLLCIGASMFLTACSTKKVNNISSATGWNYNDSRFGGFSYTDYPGQATGPNLAFVEGGRFTMGQTEQDLATIERNNIPRTVSVSSFYMDETEVSNLHYREYVYWLSRAYGNDYPDIITKAKPDTAVWRQALAYNEPLVQYYYSHAAYNHYPVVGVNWYQAQQFAKWRSDRVNELILINHRLLKPNANQSGEDVFTTETYINGQYDGTPGKYRAADLDPNSGGKRNANYADGLLLPDYRLPTEAEWEYAALGLVGNNPEPENKRRRGEEVITDRNVYPWGPKEGTRYGQRNEHQGKFLANIKRGMGDAMGVAGGLNDNADIPAPIYAYRPNAFGLYNMAGNVSEWVLDTYRPNSGDDVSDMRPFRGNVYEKYVRLTEDNNLEEKDSLGRLPRRTLTPEEMSAYERMNLRNADLRAVLDGDSTSSYAYKYGENTLISDDAKVIKGGSWNDRAYWMSPGTRRYMQANQASSTVGFRCVMDRLGSPNGRNNQRPGHYFPNKRR